MDPPPAAVVAGKPTDGPTAGHGPVHEWASRAEALSVALRPAAESGSFSTAANASTWRAIPSLENIAGGTTSPAAILSPSNSVGPHMAPDSQSSAIGSASVWASLAALLAGDDSRGLDSRVTTESDNQAPAGGLATNDRSPREGTDLAGQSFVTGANTASPGQAVWPWQTLTSQGPDSVSPSKPSGSTPAAIDPGTSPGVQGGMEGRPGIAASGWAGVDPGPAGAWFGAASTIDSSVKVTTTGQITTGLGLGWGNSEFSPPGDSFSITGVSHPGLDTAAFSPSYHGTGVMESSGVYPGFDGAGALSVGLSAAAESGAVGGLAQASAADQGGGRSLDLSKTNELLQQLLDETRKGRQPFLPVNNRNNAFNSY